MNEAVAVCVVEGGADLVRNSLHISQRKLPLDLEAIPQRASRNERRYIIELPVGLARIDEWHDVRMREPGGDADLAQKSLGADRRSEFRTQNLYRDLTFVLFLFGEMDYCHPAAAELALDRVAVEQGVGHRRGRPGHACHFRSESMISR